MKWSSVSFVAATTLFVLSGCGSERMDGAVGTTKSALAESTTTWHFACGPTHYLVDANSKMEPIDFDGGHRFSFTIAADQLEDWACNIVQRSGQPGAEDLTYYGSRTGALLPPGRIALAGNVGSIHVRYPAAGKYTATLQAGYGTLSIEPVE